MVYLISGYKRMFERHKNNKAKPELTSMNVEYLGRHPLYPQSFYGWAEFMPNRLELKMRLKDAPEMMIPYNEITGITNSMDQGNFFQGHNIRFHQQ